MAKEESTPGKSFDTSAQKINLINSSAREEQQLEEPYYIEEELYHNPNDEYVKRSFIRKKIVKRNYSATTHRVASSSREEINSLVQKKLQDYSDRSLEKKERIKESLKASKDQFRTISNPRISEMSEENRESDYMTA